LEKLKSESFVTVSALVPEFSAFSNCLLHKFGMSRAEVSDDILWNRPQFTELVGQVMSMTSLHEEFDKRNGVDFMLL